MRRYDSTDALAPSAHHAPSYSAATIREQAPTCVLQGEISVDVCVVGGGYTGLATALHLARRGVHVAVLEQSSLGWGASGRNGGQVHVGMRRDQQWLEAKVGQADAHGLWSLATQAREHLDWLVSHYEIDCDLRLGLLHVNHKARYTAESERHVAHMRQHYGYDHIHFVAEQALRGMLASDQYHSGTLDDRGGHLHALNFALGIARAAASHGAYLYEGCEVQSINRVGQRFHVRSAQGVVNASQVVLACNGYLRGLSQDVHKHVMPINNFIAVTEPLGALATRLIASQRAVSDSRFVVRYFRMTPDHRLLFGGGENYSYQFPKDIGSLVRPHLEAVFPQLKSVRFDYAWGGTLAITPTRMPWVREVEPGVINASGFSGLGVVLAPYTGKLVADALLGDRLGLDLLGCVPVPAFPGGPALRWPTLVAGMSFSALRDFL